MVKPRSIARLVFIAAFAVGAAVGISQPAAGFPGAGSSVFINEFHYDNEGTDVGEAIEVAGPAGTNLAGYSVVLYSGSDGTSYGTLPLSGTLVDQSNGFGFTILSLPTNGLQNGSPDGIALVNGSTVVQFLSYEGTFTAADGPAAGVTSTDIGVQEGGTTPVGDSLQLAGTGSTAGDFTWVGPQPDTTGAVNTGQTFAGAPTPRPTLVISEVMQNPSVVLDDVGEWFEVHNPGSVDVDLAGWTVADNDLDEFVITSSVVVPAGGFAVLGNNATSGINGGVAVDYEYGSSFLLSNSSDEIVLIDPVGVEIDRVDYDDGATFPDPNGASMTLGDLTADNNNGTNWCEATSAFGLGDLGTPGATNDSCPTSPDVTAPVPPAAPADVVVQCAAGVPSAVDLTAIDDTDGPITVSPTSELIPGNGPNDFTLIRTWTFTDTAGNTTSVSQTITVLDNTAPTPPTAPADLTVNGAANVPPPVDLTAIDNCDGAITVSPTSELIPGNGPNDFTLIRTWTFTDTTGNTTSLSQTITVIPPDTDGDGVDDTDDLCPGTGPDPAPERLKKNRNWPEPTETFGCSPSQIIDDAGLGNGHLRFGISNSALAAWIASVS